MIARTVPASLCTPTGLITENWTPPTFAHALDWRTAFFARYWHVERVAEVAQMVVELDRSIDAHAVERLAWAHDLNRWPFAHNSERGHFDQIGNIDEYFGTDPEFTATEVRDLKGIHAKDPAGISAAARAVLIADLVTGLVEDPLFAVIGLNVHPELIPSDVDEMLGYSLSNGDLYETCRALAAEFHLAGATVAEEFSKRVRELFRDLVAWFLKLHAQGDLASICEEVLHLYRQLKKSFMQEIVFPVNNDLVCHAEMVRNEAIPWYFSHCGGTTQRLLEMDEAEFVAAVTGDGSPFREEQFRPNLDVVARDRPRRPFVTE